MRGHSPRAQSWNRIKLLSYKLYKIKVNVSYFKKKFYKVKIKSYYNLFRQIFIFSNGSTIMLYYNTHIIFNPKNLNKIIINILFYLSY